jgi:hypothetical protein
LEKITPDWSAEDVSKLAERLEGSDRLDDAGRKMAVNALRSLQCKLDACREALECLLPGLTLDLRYADPDDDKDAMRSRIKTVTDALTAVEPPK